MKTIKIRAHHVEEVLGWLLMPNIRTGLINGLYSIKQRDYAQEVIKSYSNQELKFIKIVKGIDDICDRCKKNCNKEDSSLTLNERTFNFIRFAYFMYN